MTQSEPMDRFWIIVGLLAGLGLTGCDKPAPVAPAPIFGFPQEPTEAQPQLPATKLYVGATELTAELATEPRQQQTGMMFRTNMAENAGMLFVFPVPHRASFWMKNTIVALSAAYIDSEGVIQEIHELQPHNTNSAVARSSQIQYVLEVNKGWFERQGIKPGAIIRTDKGSLRETFFGGAR